MIRPILVPRGPDPATYGLAMAGGGATGAYGDGYGGGGWACGDRENCGCAAAYGGGTPGAVGTPGAPRTPGGAPGAGSGPELGGGRLAHQVGHGRIVDNRRAAQARGHLHGGAERCRQAARLGCHALQQVLAQRGVERAHGTP
jgi:hypothetical protein